MIRKSVIALMSVICLVFCSDVSAGEIFSSEKDVENFAHDVALGVSEAWFVWQNGIRINDVDVDGSKGYIAQGDLEGSFLTYDMIWEEFDIVGKSKQYVSALKTVAKSLAEAMRTWQRGYTNDDVPFPQGDSCVYTLTLCENVPVLVNSGTSDGASAMKGASFYNYALYHLKGRNEELKKVIYAVSYAIEDAFDDWAGRCYIVEVKASGGVAPSPHPLGTGPGMVRGAKGKEGHFAGPGIDKKFLFENIMDYYKKEKNVVSSVSSKIQTG